jgi:hypothetical protein
MAFRPESVIFFSGGPSAHVKLKISGPGDQSNQSAASLFSSSEEWRDFARGNLLPARPTKIFEIQI